jgi:hypothetical protein
MPKKPTEYLVKVLHTLESSTQWLSVTQIAELSEVNYNTTKAHVRHLSRRRVLDVIEMHPANLYKLSDDAISDELVVEIKKVAEVLSKASVLVEVK